MRFQQSSDDVRYLALQNRMLMERLTIAESDIASLKDGYIGLKEDYNSLKASTASCFESKTSHEVDENISGLEDINVSMNDNDIKAVLVNSLNMMSLDVKS